MNTSRRVKTVATWSVALIVPLALAGSVVAAPSTGYYWREAYAEKMARTIRVHYTGEQEEASARLREAQQRFDLANEQGQEVQAGQAALELALARQLYGGATAGWRVTRSVCDGRGLPNKLFKFSRFRCTILIDHNDEADTADVSVQPLSASRFTYKYLS